MGRARTGSPNDVAHDMSLGMPVSGDAHEHHVGKFERHHYSLVGDFLQLQSGGLRFPITRTLRGKERALVSSIGHIHRSGIGAHLIPNLSEHNERDDSNEGACRRLYYSIEAQHDDNHHSELPG